MADVTHAAWPASKRLTMMGAVLALTVIVLDQITKAWVLYGLKFSPPGCLERTAPTCGRIEISPVFDLTMVWNRGVSFGLFGTDGMLGRSLLIIFALGIAGMLSVWLTRVERPIAALALGGIIGGAVGNLIDRVRFGAVVDFLDFSGLYFPWVFNVADAAISVGAAVLLLDAFLEGRVDSRRGEN